MPKRRKKIKPELKSALVFEAGNKCANPGCPNWRTHFHHIKHWSVYQTDDEKDMIAVCPSCHDAIHHDRIRISDETLYEWKKSHAPAAPRVAHVFVEPRRAGARLLTGTFAIETHNPGATVFELSNHNMLQFHTSNRDTMLVSSTVIDLTGREVLSVENNYVRSHEDPDVVFDYVAGHVRITAPATGRFIPYPVLAEVRNKEPGYAADGRVVILDLSVVAPGVVTSVRCVGGR